MLPNDYFKIRLYKSISSMFSRVYALSNECRKSRGMDPIATRDQHLLAWEFLKQTRRADIYSNDDEHAGFRLMLTEVRSPKAAGIYTCIVHRDPGLAAFPRFYDV